MSDEFYEVGGDRGGRSPITPLGKVVYNAFRDDNLIREFRKNAKSKLSIYPGPVDDESVTIYPREIAIRKRTTRGRRGGKENDAMYVISTVAGMGDESEPLYRTIEDYEVVGVTVTRAIADSKGNDGELDVVVQTGGMTTIRHTGNKRIENGDTVYVEWPDPKNSYERGTKGSERQPLWTMPLDPEMDSMTKKAFIHAIKHPVSTGNYEYSRDEPLVEGAELINNCLHHTYLQAAHVLAATGVMKFTNSGLDMSKKGLASRMKAAKDYATSSNKEDRLAKLATYMGACDKDSVIPLDVPGPYIKGSEPSVTTLNDYITNTCIGDDDNYNLAPLQPGTNKLPRGIIGSIVRKQKSNIEDTIAGVNRTNRFKNRRALGKALSSADPGTDFEILLGRYQL